MRTSAPGLGMSPGCIRGSRSRNRRLRIRCCRRSRAKRWRFNEETMTWLEFIASIIQALAWPAVVIAAVILLRKPLAAVIPLLRRLTYKDCLLYTSDAA